MKFHRLTYLFIALAALLCAGCFDLEAEVKILEDGSGFVTVWARVPTRIAVIGTAMGNQSLADARRDLLLNLDELFAERDGIQLVERLTFTEADQEVLRYRYAFDSARQLNEFWAVAQNRDQDVTLRNAQLTVTKTGDDNQARYEAKLVFPAQPATEIYALTGTIFANQPLHVRKQVVEEYYKGGFRLRLALPGKIGATDASQVDTGDYPIWQTRLLDLYLYGLTASATSTVQATPGEPARPTEADESFPAPSTPLTAGPHATIGDMWRALDSLGDLVRLEIEVDVAKRSRMTVTYRVDQRIDRPLESLLTLPLVTLPTVAPDWTVETQRDERGRLLYRLSTKEPLRLDKTESPHLFAGRESDRYVFRMNLPQLTFAEHRPPEAAGTVAVKVIVTMPHDIHTGNATVINGNKAEWTLTTRDLLVPLTLEAICDK